MEISAVPLHVAAQRVGQGLASGFFVDRLLQCYFEVTAGALLRFTGVIQGSTSVYQPAVPVEQIEVGGTERPVRATPWLSSCR